jgi:hypothetical protein
MKVYMIMHGEMSEGGTVDMVFDSFALAFEYAEDMANAQGLTYLKDDTWTDGCDWISVQEYSVESQARRDFRKKK